MSNIDSGDQVIGRKRRGIAPEGVEDTEGHVARTYPAVVSDELDCLKPLPGEQDEGIRRRR